MGVLLEKLQLNWLFLAKNGFEWQNFKKKGKIFLCSNFGKFVHFALLRYNALTVLGGLTAKETRLSISKVIAFKYL